ncbi:MAG: 50S ribosomal protein L31e [archaeon]|nr:MAG: 50S ribosomal protein L31e [archaeon]
MAKKKQEPKIEKVYTIPLRKEWLKVPKYKRSKKAVKAIKEFLVRHMKIRDRDLKKVKIGDWVNKAIWSRGIKSPPHKITVKATKQGDNVTVDFVNLPNKFKEEDKRLRRKLEKERKRLNAMAKKKAEEEAKRKAEEAAKKAAEKVEEKTEEEKKKEEEKKEREKELRKTAKPEPQQVKISKQKKQVIQRKALKK